MPKVTVFSTPTCTYCTLAKQYFKLNNVAYEEFDVSADQSKLQEMVQKSGQMGVPVILINDEVIVGFDEARIRQLIGK